MSKEIESGKISGSGVGDSDDIDVTVIKKASIDKFSPNLVKTSDKYKILLGLKWMK